MPTRVGLVKIDNSFSGQHRLPYLMGVLQAYAKLLQIPLVVAHELGSPSHGKIGALCKKWAVSPESLPGLGEFQWELTYRYLLKVLTEGNALDPTQFPILTQVRWFFKTRDIQRDEVEYYHAPEWLDVYWPPDEYILLRLLTDGVLDDFYAEAERALIARVPVPPEVIRDAVRLNRALLKLPFQTEDADVECSWNVLEFYRSAVRGEPIPVVRSPHRYHVDRTTTQWATNAEWCEKLVWYMSRSGAYLHKDVRMAEGPLPAGRY